jgi:hypothetical protein
MLGAAAVVLLGAIALGLQIDAGKPTIRVALWSLVCGLVGYLFYSLGLPGSGFLEDMTPGLRGLLIGFCCGLLPLLVVARLALRKRMSA